MHEINVYKWTETGVKTSDWMEILIRSMHIFGMGLHWELLIVQYNVDRVL